MSRLFESFEKLDANAAYNQISPRQSFFCALMSAFVAGAEMVRVLTIINPHKQQGDIWVEAAFLTLWLVLGLRWGRRAWECAQRCDVERAA